MDKTGSYFTFSFGKLVEVNEQDPRIFYTNEQIEILEDKMKHLW
jgi:hypothetical protein